MKMTVKIVDVLDGRTLRVSTGGTIILQDVTVPSLLTVAGIRAKTRLEELVLHKSVECDVSNSDINGNFIAQVWTEDTNVNKAINAIVKAAPPGKGDPPAAEKKVKIQIDESVFSPPDASRDKPKT